MQTKDYYFILGVERDVGNNGIKKAYRALAHKYHPDVSADPDGEDKFKQVGEAYKTLKVPAARAAYDRLISPGRQTMQWLPVGYYVSALWWINFWIEWERSWSRSGRDLRAH